MLESLVHKNRLVKKTGKDDVVEGSLVKRVDVGLDFECLQSQFSIGPHKELLHGLVVLQHRLVLQVLQQGQRLLIEKLKLVPSPLLILDAMGDVLVKVVPDLAHLRNVGILSLVEGIEHFEPLLFGKCLHIVLKAAVLSGKAFVDVLQVVGLHLVEDGVDNATRRLLRSVLQRHLFPLLLQIVDETVEANAPGDESPLADANLLMQLVQLFIFKERIPSKCYGDPQLLPRRIYVQLASSAEGRYDLVGQEEVI